MDKDHQELVGEGEVCNVPDVTSNVLENAPESLSAGKQSIVPENVKNNYLQLLKLGVLHLLYFHDCLLEFT